MKKSIAILVLNLIAFAGYSQKFAISNNRDNILYLGIPNHISIAAENCPCKLLSIKADSASISESAPCEYEMTFSRVADIDIEIIKNTGKGKKTIGKRKFQVRFLPDPEATVFGRKSGDHISNTELAACGGLIAHYPDFLSCYPTCAVTYYTVIVLRNGNVIYSKTFSNARFNDELKKQFTSLHTEDIVVFSNFIAKENTGRIFHLRPVQLTIKD